jgi:2-polyprenyl-6-methoxyphenol hydroxylase-like FAD-dependent oxidoreductase
MTTKPNLDVLIVGAGPVGLYAALSLTRRGADVRIIDREWRTGAHSYALALHPSSLRLLEEVGLREQVLSRARRIRSVEIFDGAERRVEIPLNMVGEDFAFVSVLRQDLLETTLEEALKNDGVRVKWNHEASLVRQGEDYVEVRIDRLEGESRGYGVEHGEKVVAKSRSYKSSFVIGADGHESDVRQMLNIPFREIRPAQHFAVFEFKTDADLGDALRIIFHDDLTSVVWPMPDGHCRWSFQLPHTSHGAIRRSKDRYVTEQADAVSAMLDQDDLRRLLTERAPWFLGSIDGVKWQKIVRFENRLVDSFGQGRVWLAGDSGHLTAPGGVQSMNVGLREAELLSRMMSDVIKNRAGAGILADYGTSSLKEWQVLHGILPLDPEPADAWLAAHISSLLPSIPLSGRALQRALAIAIGNHAHVA